MHSPGISKRISCEGQLSLHKILFHFKALLWESIISLLPLLTCKAYFLSYYCTTIAQYIPPTPTPSFYAIHHTILVMAISCKGQPRAPLRWARLCAYPRTPQKPCCLTFTGYCRDQHCTVYGLLKGDRGGVVYCAMVVQ